MEEFIEEFKAEASAIIDNLQTLLVSYEESTSKMVTAEEVFRGIHTLKGTAKMFGFDRIESVTHTLENILDEHRKRNIPFTPDFTEIILATLDFCMLALERKENIQAMQDILGRIGSYAIAEDAGMEKIQISVYSVILKPDDDIFQRGISLASVLNEIKSIGDSSTFDRGTEGKSLEQQILEMKLERAFDISVAMSKPIEDLEDVFMFFKPHEFTILPLTNDADLSSSFDAISNSRQKSLSKIEQSLREEFYAARVAQGQTLIIKDVTEKQPVIENTDTQKLNGEPHESNVKLNYINVPLAKLDHMMNLVSEFVTLTGEVKFYASLLASDGLQSVAERLEKVSTNFRDNAFNLRLVPIQILAIKLQRYVKDLSAQLGKKVRFITEGMDTEIDKSIINQIEGPLMHIIRNAIDHGIESPEERVVKGKNEEGILKLAAFYSGTNAFIHVQDDGAGIAQKRIVAKAIEKGIIQPSATLSKQEAINLIFQPGFTTTESATEISGRGVGMDVVQKNIQALRGSVEVTTEEDLGTSFAIRLPLTLSIMDVMIVKVGDLNYMIPNGEIEFCTSERFTDQVQRRGHNLRYKNDLIPFVKLRSVFNESAENGMESCILVLEKNDRLVAVEVDQILGKEQVVVKPVDETLQVVPHLSGTSILGNGELAFLIDVLKLKELYALEK